MPDHDPTGPDAAHLPPALDPTPEAPPALIDRALAWAARKSPLLLKAGAAFQLLFLVTMVAVFARPHVDPSSRTVLLRVVPVDPRDLLRGDYVILSYDVSRPPSGVAGVPGQTVYAGLKPDADGRHYVLDGVQDAPFADGRVFLKGTLLEYGRVSYGIESYYVQEGRGRDYENAAVSRRLSAEVAVAPDGTAGLTGLVIE